MNNLIRFISILGFNSALINKLKIGVSKSIRILWDSAFAFFTEESLMRASSLAFTTLVSIVPLLTVGLRFMNFYGMSHESRSEIESIFAQYLLPSQSRDIVSLITKAASDVTENVGAFGLLSFSLTLIFMARELEGHILKICKKSHTWWVSALHYAAFVVLVPTGVIFSFSILHPLAIFLDILPERWAHFNYPFMLVELLVILILRTFSDYSLSWQACTTGAIASGVAVWASWKGCALYFATSATVSAYGALSCIPAFFLWIFIAWCCMLFGVQVAAKTQKAFFCPNEFH